MTPCGNEPWSHVLLCSLHSRGLGSHVVTSWELKSHVSLSPCGSSFHCEAIVLWSPSLSRSLTQSPLRLPAHLRFQGCCSTVTFWLFFSLPPTPLHYGECNHLPLTDINMSLSLYRLWSLEVSLYEQYFQSLSDAFIHLFIIIIMSFLRSPAYLNITIHILILVSSKIHQTFDI